MRFILGQWLRRLADQIDPRPPITYTFGSPFTSTTTSTTAPFANVTYRPLR